MAFRSNRLRKYISTLLTPSLLFLLSAQPTLAEAREDFESGSINTHTVVYDGYDLHYASAGNQSADGIMFIHGTPGSWRAFRDYLGDARLQKNYFLISVDRSGWGKSGVPQQGMAASFDNQANSIVAVLNQYPNKKWLLVGHSLGASIAPKIALAAPNSIAAMLLLAGSIEPQLGKPRWYNRFANSWLFSWLVPSKLKDSNDEIMLLRAELEQMERDLSRSNLHTQVVVVQGMRDRLVSPKNLRYVRQNWANIFSQLTVIELPEAGHFLPWNNSEEIIQLIEGIEF